MERAPRALGAVAALAVLGVAAACTGENYFTGPGLGSTAFEAPTIEISAPAADAALTQGDSVQVTAAITAANGVNQITFSGTFIAGTTAYVQRVVSLTGATDTTLSRFLQPAGTETGDARIVVQATDLLGNTGADTVLVSVN